MATVDAVTGQVTPKQAGQTTITVSCAVDEDHVFVSATLTYTATIIGTLNGVKTVSDALPAQSSVAVYDLRGCKVADRLDDVTRRQLPAGIYIVGGCRLLLP